MDTWSRAWAGSTFPVGSALSLGVTESWVTSSLTNLILSGKEMEAGTEHAGPKSTVFSSLCCFFRPHEAPVMSAWDGRPQEKDPQLGAQTLSILLCDYRQAASLLWALVSSSVKYEDLLNYAPEPLPVLR